jgi:phage-related minor tail protein
MAKQKSKPAAPQQPIKKSGDGGKIAKNATKVEQAKATAKAVVAASQAVAKPAIEKAQKAAKPVVAKAQEVAGAAGEKIKGVLKESSAQVCLLLYLC